MYAVGYAHGDLNDDPAAGDGSGAQQFTYDGNNYDLRQINEDNGVRGLISARSVAINPLSVDGAAA